jgi:Carboxypeptidase regulatory-like domain
MRPLARKASLLLALAVGVPSYAQIGNASGSSENVHELYLQTSPSARNQLQQHAHLVDGNRLDYKTSERQPAGYISGTVFDQSGAVSVGAAVRLSREDPALNQEVQSGNNGQFSFPNVSPGEFHLTVASSGFATREFAGTLRPGEAYLVPPITLFVATAVTEVHVKETPLTPVELADEQIKDQEKQRVFGLFPNFYVTYVADAVPLTPKQKFRLAWKTSVDPMTLVGISAIAGVEQATDAFPGYGQGAEGYAKRFGATYVDVVTGTVIGSAVLPWLLRQDPRYFYKGTGSTGSRLLYALGSPLFCKGDNRRWQPNYSNVLGAFASAGISYLYHPESDRNGAGLVVRNSLIRLGETAFEGVLQEFVIRRLTPRLGKRASDQR